MDKKDLWDRWADPSDCAEYGGSFDDLPKEEANFYKDLDAYFVERQQKELEETKDKLLEHIEKLRENDGEDRKAWDMDPKDMQKQVQKQLKNLKSIKL